MPCTQKNLDVIKQHEVAEDAERKFWYAEQMHEQVLVCMDKSAQLSVYQ